MTSHRQVIGLDVVRFLAAFGVMTFHLSYWAWAHPDGTAGRVTGGTIRFVSFTSLTSAAWVGVDVFFVLSGFVIVYSASILVRSSSCEIARFVFGLRRSSARQLLLA